MESVAFTVPAAVATPTRHQTLGSLRCSCFAPSAVFTPAAKLRSRVKMQEGADGADEDAPSDTYVPASEAMDPVGSNAAQTKRTSMISRLLQLAAVTSRGQLATDGQMATMDDIVMSLEELNPNPQPVETDLIDGLWTLVYSSARLFQSSKLLMLAAKPLLELGQVRQRIAVNDGTLVTEVDLVAFPATSGTLKTTGRVTPVGAERLEVTVEKTTVTGGKLVNTVDLGGLSFDIPVEQLFTRFRNAAPETYIDTYYLDDNLRISRSKEGKLYIYTRLE